MSRGVSVRCLPFLLLGARLRRARLAGGVSSSSASGVLRFEGLGVAVQGKVGTAGRRDAMSSAMPAAASSSGLGFRFLAGGEASSGALRFRL